ncbi:Yip1 domain protein [Roseivivax sp. THAF40]|uniref:YIP1 family protein n=1 Tax=unclassified Roseivivax TaxID=2639302 RepID=UPI0012A7E423|nr:MULTISPECIES: YIP1 family protein [unclassified Roseivivax]QFS82808.1 Yip1 domain protein [Roseivivax sp. THAF197b]QFT46577.1 Yip1 domain protein [Roseivivax sp. THAF40]
MTPLGFLRLAWQSVIAPREVARLLLSLRLGHEALLVSAALVLVLNTAIVRASTILTPPDPAIAPFVTQPLTFFMGLGGILAIVALVLTWCGRAVGGTGRIEDVGLMMIWLQGLRVIVQLVMLVLAPIAATLAALVSIAASLVGLWILVNFLAEAHEFPTLGKAAFVLLLAVTGLALGLSFFFTLIGATASGMT